MRLDWPTVANGVATELIVAFILALIAGLWFCAKRLASWFARRAAARLPGEARDDLESDWQGNIDVSSKATALIFAISLWWHSAEVSAAAAGSVPNMARIGWRSARMLVKDGGLLRAARLTTVELIRRRRALWLSVTGRHKAPPLTFLTAIMLLAYAKDKVAQSQKRR